MSYEEYLNNQIPAFNKYLDDNINTITTTITYEFTDNYDCVEDGVFNDVVNMHKKFIVSVKQQIINKGYNVIKYEYKDNYINYADCYRSKCIYYIEKS